MSIYRVEVVEVRSVGRIYWVEADNESDAYSLAESGETVAEEGEEYDVTQRFVTNGPFVDDDPPVKV
jgi:hypothetical protein